MEDVGLGTELTPLLGRQHMGRADTSPAGRGHRVARVQQQGHWKALDGHEGMLTEAGKQVGSEVDEHERRRGSSSVEVAY